MMNRWLEGIYLGNLWDTGEAIVALNSGKVIRARALAPRPQGVKLSKAMFEAIPLAVSVGIFAANNQRIKDLFLPSPSRCLADIHRALPEI